jgi:hypothetical protein
MRIVPWVIFAALSLAISAGAQSAPQRTPVNGASEPASIASLPDPSVAAVVSAVMPRAAVWGPVKGVPFSATQTTVREQTLSDGTVIKSTVEVQLWRDGEGRMRAESRPNPNVSGQQQTHIVAIWNPIDRTEISWVSGSPSANVATVLHLPELQMNDMLSALSAPPAPPSSSVSRSLRTGTPAAVLSAGAGRDAAKIHMEDLPADSIAGQDVTGTRTTQVVPAGSIDNDRDFTVTSETWISPELKTTVRQTTSDPRTGTVTTELSNIDRSEPDPALFRPPAGYKLMDLQDPSGR